VTAQARDCTSVGWPNRSASQPETAGWNCMR
jgi:hypothetical protein